MATIKRLWRRVSTKRRLIILVPLLILVAVWLGRGFLRDTVARKYASLTYGRHVKAVFANEIGPVDHQALLSLGLRPAQKPDSADACAISYFTFFQETVTCDVLQQTQVNETPDMLARWKKNFPVFDAYLLGHGWKHANASQVFTPPDQFFAKGYSTGAVYAKQIGKVECSIQLFYVQDPTDPGFKSYLSSYEVCARDVKFFGGNDQLYSGGWHTIFRK